MDAYKVVRDFEKAMAEFTSAPHAVSVESCSAAIFLCCVYCKVKDIDEVVIPKYTYPSIPASIVNAGGRVGFEDVDWQKEGCYGLRHTAIVDSAKRLCKGMFTKRHFICLSFHGKKVLPIGRGGMILTDSEKARDWFKLARFDGRHERSLPEDRLAMAGWNMYMTPDQAARGLERLQWLSDRNIDLPNPYQDLSKYKFYTEANR